MGRDTNGDDEDEDRIDMDEVYDSQDSRRGKKLAETHELCSDHSTAFSTPAMRSNMDLYAALVVAHDDELRGSVSHNGTASSSIVDHIMSLPESTILSSRKTLSALPQMGLILDPIDAERLLEYCTENILSKYIYERSEVAIGAILEVMSSLTPAWTNVRNSSLYGLGIDMYEWYMFALSKKVLSPNVQKQIASLLLQLCQVDTDYGRDSGTESGQSARTSLFQLLEKGCIVAQHRLAGGISVIFGLFVLSKHEDIFNDLQRNLPTDADWIEGMAMRLLILAKLASAWHSLLRRCVYAIFETAGLVKSSTQHAAHCIRLLTVCLGFSSAQKLFFLFAPQLLHSWLENSTLTGLPYVAFQYASLEELLGQNQVEITAQLLMRGKEDSMLVMINALKLSGKELAKRAFAKSLAYAISRDVSNKLSGQEEGCEGRLRQLTTDNNKAEFKKITVKHFPAIMGQLYLSAQQEGDHEKWLEKCKGYESAAKALTEMKSYGQSTRTLPGDQQPYFKIKYLPEQIARLCRRTGNDPLQPWSPSAFALALRMHLDAIDDALGSLHKSLMLRKLRTLICMAGEVALSGYPMEMLVNTIVPFLSDGECADDALGLLKFVLLRGASLMRRDNIEFTHGTILVMVLRMQEHSITRQDRTTQESQHNLTVQKMEDFRQWLVEYLQQCRPSRTNAQAPTNQAESHSKLVKALETVHLPGNARKTSPESSLLLLLLDQQHEVDPLVSPSHSGEALRLLTKDFVAPTTSLEDCIGADDASASYADSLWHLIKRSAVDDGLLLWATVALGRAYVATGVRPRAARRPVSDYEGKRNKYPQGNTRSLCEIAIRLSDLVQSPKRAEAGLADWTLRKAQVTFKEAGDAVAFEQMLPNALVPATANGTFGYEPPLAAEATAEPVDRQHLRQALELAPATSDETWSIQFAVSLCRWTSGTPLLSALPALLHNISGLAMELLPCIVHIVLSGEADQDPALRTEISRSVSVHLEDRNPALRSRRKLLLQILLYLRGQPFPGEETRADRTRWLEVDLMLAADAAAHCDLPTAALLFAESTTPVVQASRRSSSRVSVSQLAPVQVPDDLLVFIFKQIEEPDSFYGVQQSASLDSVLERLDYEGDGLRSLMFRSAQMDSAMRLAHTSSASDSQGMLHSLSALNLHSLEYILLAAPLADAASSREEMLDTARKLQQWDIASPDPGLGGAAASFSAFQCLSRASNLSIMAKTIRSLLLAHAKVELRDDRLASPPVSWCNVLAILTEVSETLDSPSDDLLQSCWQNMQVRSSWMQTARHDDSSAIISSRSTLFSVLAQNGSVSKAMHASVKLTKTLEAKSLLHVAESARQHGVLQEALSAAAQASTLSAHCKNFGLDITAATKMETAHVLWDAGEASTSVKMLRDVLRSGGTESQSIPVGRSGLLAHLAHQLETARMEKPDEIHVSCLQPAVKYLHGRTEGREAGKVFHEFAVFCDHQLQNPTTLEDFNRLAKLRLKRQEEHKELEKLFKSKTRHDDDWRGTNLEMVKAKKWYELNDAEYQRLKQSRDAYMQQSLQNYLLTLHASDHHDVCVLRFFALWLENADDPTADTVVSKHLSDVPSYKFVVLLNQLMSRLANEPSAFQASLNVLVKRICAEHPYHGLHHLYAATREPGNYHDIAAMSRFRAAEVIARSLKADRHKGDLVTRTFSADDEYNVFAHADHKPIKPSPRAVPEFQPAVHMTVRIVSLGVAPATISLPLRPDGAYTGVPIVARWRSVLQVLGGVSAPKALVACGNNGVQYKQLFKYNDDLRQDAIMEQVFEEVSKMLRNHKAARQRNLQVRTYKVIPLEARAGILEWVPNSIPIGDFLKPAHRRYYPHGMKTDDGSTAIRNCQDRSLNTRVSTFRKVCEQLPPVMRHFFFERFNDPDEWFEKRTAYTRTTATISILGYVLGLGDRHCQNILLDEKSGEAVHIDLGVAFEAGRVLTVPETVPFRLSRDIVDGMGVTKTEGVFRRCCEFTMDALREEKDSIMTLLNVLRYDPLYNWTVSPLRAKQMQDAQETDRNGDGAVEGASSKGKEQDLGEADRALSVVENKLSKTLSTAATVNELIQQATDDKNLATLYFGWSAHL
ncbi:hypothetical protein LTR08_007848 [Meristemomyces frigidus]|nr:hypothetical protein LTR08_007848 [Meristemomyces frigidus]